MFRILKRENIIMGASALMVFIVAVGFTFEPLFTIIARSDALPVHTSMLARIPSEVEATAVSALVTDLIKNRGGSIPEPTIEPITALLLPRFSGTRTLMLHDETTPLLPVSITLKGYTGGTAPVIAALRQLISRTHLIEETHTLPDGTNYIEIVADPATTELTDAPLPLAVTLGNDEQTILSTSPTPFVSGKQTRLPLGCRTTSDRVHIVTYSTAPRSTFLAFFTAIPNYLAHFECFQIFSTFVGK